MFGLGWAEIVIIAAVGVLLMGVVVAAVLIGIAALPRQN